MVILWYNTRKKWKISTLEFLPHSKNSLRNMFLWIATPTYPILLGMLYDKKSRKKRHISINKFLRRG
jgi:hypothetical protein